MGSEPGRTLGFRRDGSDCRGLRLSLVLRLTKNSSVAKRNPANAAYMEMLVNRSYE